MKKTDANDILRNEGPDALRDKVDGEFWRIKTQTERATTNGEDHAGADPPKRKAKRPSKFTLEPFESITFNQTEEWLIKRFLPRQGTAILYGDVQTFKSFVALDLALKAALGWEWGGRRVEQVDAVFIAAEGSAGLRKRKAAFLLNNAEKLRGKTVRFWLISVAPNLGIEKGDLAELTAAIESAGVEPGLIVIDTIAPCIGPGDENGGGMMQLVANMTALANHFRALVLGVHHIGLLDHERMRGHSSLKGGADVLILAERKAGALSTVLKLVKSKEEESNITLTAHLSRTVIAKDQDGEEISTLTVDRVEAGGEALAAPKPKKPPPRSLRLLLDMAKAAVDEAGEDYRPFADGPLVRAVPDAAVRVRYYARIAEKPCENENPDALAERQRRAFNRAIGRAIDAKDLAAVTKGADRMLWLP